MLINVYLSRHILHNELSTKFIKGNMTYYKKDTKGHKTMGVDLIMHIIS